MEVIPSGCSSIARCISSLDLEDWQWIESKSRSKCLWFKLEFWHNKYYRDNPPNDGYKIQVPK